MAQYQREKGFTYFNSFEEVLQAIGERKGEKMELECRRALARYGLYGEKPDDLDVDLYLMPMYHNIEYSHQRREDGFKAARYGQAGGRPPVYDHDEIQRMHEDGKSLDEIAKATGASKSTIKRATRKSKEGDDEGAITDDGYAPSGLYNNYNNISTMDNGGALKAPPKREYIAYKDKSDDEYESDNDTDTEYDNDIDTEYEPEDDYKDDTDNDYNDEYEYNRGLMNPFEPYEPQHDMPRDREFESLMEDDIPF